MEQVQAETRPGMSPAVVDENQRSSYMGAGAAAGGVAVAGGSAAVAARSGSAQVVGSGSEDAQLNKQMDNLRTQDAHAPRQSVDSVRTVEVANAAPGPPAGAVAFDHPPTEEEKARARQQMEGEEAGVRSKKEVRTSS